MATVATRHFISFFFTPMKTLAIRALVGATSLAFAIPLVGAQGITPSADRPAPTQQCVQAMANAEAIHFSQFDSQSARQKQFVKMRSDGLAAAAAITDDAARKQALKDLHTQIKAARDAAGDERSAELKAAHEAVKAACGDLGRKGPGGKHFGGARRGGPRGNNN